MVAPEVSKIHRDTALFGGNREAAIQRDGEKCLKCGMTRTQHVERYGRDITVDHIDGRGCNSPKELKNNDLDNLQTLCIRCHARKDNAEKRLTEEQVLEIYGLEGKMLRKDVAAMFGVTPSMISYVMNGTWWTDTYRQYKGEEPKTPKPRGRRR